MNSPVQRTVPSKLIIIGIITLISSTTVFTLFAQKRGILPPSSLQQDWEYAPDVVIVKFRSYSQSPEMSAPAENILTLNGAIRFERLFRSFKHLPSPKNNIPDLRTVYRVRLSPGSDVKAIAASLSLNRMIEYAEPDYLIPLNGIIPNDPLYGSQPHLPQIHAPAAWDSVTGDSNIIIGIIDMGVDWDHPDLAASIWNNADEIDGNGMDDDGNGFVDDVRGWDFVREASEFAHSGEDAEVQDNNPMDFHGHGTHVAGLAAAVTNNATGVASISFGVKLMPLRIGYTTPDGGGSSFSSWLAEAYVYAADNGADVTNLSFGNSSPVLTGARYAFDNDVVIVVSAGNENDEIPAAALVTVPWAISVASVNNANRKASYSSFGDWVTLSAPGGDFSSGNGQGLLSTIVTPSSFYGGASYVQLQGTSMSSPMAAGLVALTKSRFPAMSAAELMFQVVETADNIDGLNPAYIGKLGSGRINAERAVTETVFAPPRLRIISVMINDTTGGNGNGVLEAGESADIIISFSNIWGDAVNLSSTLSSDDWAVTVSDNAAIFPNISGLKDLNNSTGDNSTDPFTIDISVDAVPHTMSFMFALTGDNFSESFNFSLPISPLLLFVDDDHNANNVENYYTDTFDALNISYSSFERLLDGDPPTFMASFPLVFWGCEWAFPSLDNSDRAAIGVYLNGGGNLLIAGQDIGWDLNDPWDGGPNEFNLSGGASKTWYETYLKSVYVSDDAGRNDMVGVTGDPIGEGISFNRLQPGLPSQFQFPSVISATSGASEVFRYGSEAGGAGAVRYKGGHGLVHFAFGGVESITDFEIRTEIVRRSIAFLTGINTEFSKLTDTEVIGNYTVDATVTADATIASATLWWDVDGAFPFNQVAMTALGGGNYTAQIPAQDSSGANIDYFVLVYDDAGAYSPFRISSFFAGVDTIKPVLELVSGQRNTINQVGPYTVSVTGFDNSGLDSASGLLHYSINSNPEETTALIFDGTGFSGDITAPSILVEGNTVEYFFTMLDNSSMKNPSRLPADTNFSFQIVPEELVDDFENGTGLWDLGNIWSLDPTSKSGANSISTGPYSNNLDESLTFSGSFNFSTYDAATIKFWTRYGLAAGDTLYVEFSNDGTNWSKVQGISGIATWTLFEVISPEFGGSGNESVKLRFRLVTDSTGNSFGIWVDEIYATSGQVVSAEDEQTAALPKEFSLEQNYPNPFNPETAINYAIPQNSSVRLTIYNILGQKISTLIDEQKSSGVYSVSWNGRNDTGNQVASGLYFYRLEARHINNGNQRIFVDAKKMLLLR